MRTTQAVRRDGVNNEDLAALASLVEKRQRNANVECMEGWSALVVSTVDAMVDVVKPDGSFTIFQIKEKLGGLRIYTRDPDWPDRPGGARALAYNL